MRSEIRRFLAVLCASIGATASAVAGMPRSEPPAAISIYANPLLLGERSTVVPDAVAADLARRINRIEKLRKQLSSDEGFLRAADEGTLLLLFNRTEGKAELLREYAPRFESIPVPEHLFHHLDLALDDLWREIERLAPTYSQDPGHPLMKTLATALERRLRAVVPKATFVGGMLREREWRVRLSTLGLPESRTMSGVVFYRMPDQQWVICREFELSQGYFKRESVDGPCEITFGCLRLQA